MSGTLGLAALGLFAWACGEGPADPPENRPPVVTGTIPAHTVVVGQTVTLDLSEYFEDPDGDALSYIAVTGNAELAVVSVSGSAARVTGVARGTTTITVAASDPDGLTARQSFAVTVPNRAPDAVGTIPDLELFKGDTARIDLSAYFTDPDGDALAYEVATTDGDVATAALDGDTANVGAVSAGMATITVTASDPDGLTARQSFTVTVPNRAPEAVGTIPDLELFKGDTARIDLSAYFTDPDGDVLAHEVATTVGDVATFAVEHNTLAVSAVTGGTTSVTITATDDGGLSAKQSFSTRVMSPTPEVEFATRLDQAPEGETFVVEVTATPAPDSTIKVGYTLGADDDPETDDADEADHGGGTGGTALFNSGATRITLEIGILDDREIEATREVLVISLHAPAKEAGYSLGQTTAATLTIEEGVCDRTPRVRDELMARAQVDLCHEAERSHLEAIDTLDLRGPTTMAYERPHAGWGVAGGPACGQDPIPILRGSSSAYPDATPAVCPPVTLARVAPPPPPKQGAGDGEAIRELRVGDFSELSALQELWLFSNELAELPAGVFSGLPELRRLHLGFNRLTELPAGLLSGLSRLEDFSAQENHLRGLPPNLFSGLSRLQGIWMYRNELAELPTGLFSDLSNLEELHLWENRLDALPAGIFRGLARLRVLSLGFNRLTELDGNLFTGLADLEHLRLDANRLTELTPGTFLNLGSLEHLDLRQNRLQEISNGVFEGLASLVALSLATNQIADIESGAFSGLSGLEHLYLLENRLADLSPGAFSGLSGLQFLTLRDNRITGLEPGLFDGLPLLRELDLGANLFAELESDVFAGLSGLERLWMDEGQLRALHAGVFNGLSGLSRLMLHRNQLTALGSGAFAGLSSLAELWLHTNRITGVPDDIFADLAQLRKLGMWDNRMAELPPGLFSELTRLEELSLARNVLETLPPGGFSDLERLEILRVSSNQLSELPERVFAGLAKLTSINLGGNPGAPFTLEVGFERTDTTDPDAPGPAQVVVYLAEGAPFSMKIPLEVTDGTLSTDTAVIKRGQTRSEEFTVTMDSTSDSGTEVVAGPAPPVPAPLHGLELVADDTLILFRDPLAEADPELDLAARAGGQSPGGGKLVPAVSATGALRSGSPWTKSPRHSSGDASTLGRFAYLLTM